LTISANFDIIAPVAKLQNVSRTLTNFAGVVKLVDALDSKSYLSEYIKNHCKQTETNKAYYNKELW